MLVEGKPLRFLVDTGATRSCISLKQEKSDKFRESDCVIYATTASGKVISDKLSVPLQCIYDNQCFALPFALSEECPFNLLGRDALCKMKMMIVCDEESGVTCEAWRLLRESEDLYVYMWLLTESETLRNVELWAKDRYDVGLIKNCPEVRITPKSNYRPHKPQYPVKRDALEGITPVFESLLERGIIIPCADSPVNTPIFPIKKIRDVGQPEEWRFVQDLQAVNAAVVARAPNVPNPYTILSQIPSDTTHFTSVDISNAFFSVPVHKNSQFWFAFTFKGKRYTFTKLCQGYCESPTIYNDALHENLLSLKLPKGVALLQYVDDLLLCAPSREVCLEATLKLLNHLAENGHKVNIKKVSIAEEQVTFLGHVISKNGKHISEKRISGVL
uniref:ribonuclease H n=1 Tax=Cyprinus carpio carpio TaxID=630221 RepID=A0A9J8BCE1_CYPCA